MFLSKIWFILVAVAAGVALSIALTAPRPMAQKLEELEGQRLDRAQYAAEQMLKVDAHKWIDRTAKLGRDAILSEALDSASRGSGELSVQHKTVQTRIRSLLPDLTTAGIASIIAVDANGRVVARVGENEKDYSENIGGAEVIADALRGYLSDDVWGANGRLLRVAGAPVLSKSRDRIVGALVIGAETGPQFAERLKKNLDMDVALLLRGKIIASTLESSQVGSLPEMVGQRKAEIEEVKRTPALPIEVGSETLLVVAAPFPGQASQQDGYYALIGRKPAKADLGSLLASTSARDLKWGQFPWIPLVGSILAAVAIGIFLQRLEFEAPISKLRAELGQLARGELSRVNDTKFGGKFGGVARDVNAAIEHHAMSSMSGGIAAPELQAPPPHPADNGSPGGAFAAPSLFAPAAPSGFGATGPGGITAPPPPAAFVPPAFPAPARPGTKSMPPQAPPSLFDEPIDDDKHMQDVYAEFLATKQQCGESAVGLTLEKFKQRLQDNKASLMAKHVCRTVRFSVYVKDGKAALRATPVK